MTTPTDVKTSYERTILDQLETYESVEFELIEPSGKKSSSTIAQKFGLGSEHTVGLTRALYALERRQKLTISKEQGAETTSDMKASSHTKRYTVTVNKR